MPLKPLYSDGWPGPLRRAGQLVFSAVQWILHRHDAMVLTGTGLPAAKGALQVSSRLRLRDWLAGAYVMNGAALSRLLSNLGLDPSLTPELYLADADVLVVLGWQKEGLPVVIHVAGDAQRLARYRQCAERARQQLATAGQDHLVPVVLEQRAVLDLSMLVQQRVAGRVVRPADLSPNELEQHVAAALQPLRALALNSLVAFEGIDDALLKHELARLEADPRLAEAVRAPLAALRNWSRRKQHPAVLAHGDYWFPNILFTPNSPPQVAGLIDWERSRLNTFAGFDELHLVMFSYSEWRGTTPFQVLCMLWDDQCEPDLERLLRHACQVAERSTEDLRHVALLLWLLHLSRHAPDMPAWNDARRRDWLDTPARHAMRWLARVQPR